LGTSGFKMKVPTFKVASFPFCHCPSGHGQEHSNAAPAEISKCYKSGTLLEQINSYFLYVSFCNYRTTTPSISSL